MLHIETARLNLLPPKARQRVREMAEAYADGQVLSDSSARRLEKIQAKLTVLDAEFFSNGRISPERAAEREQVQKDFDEASRRRAVQVEASREVEQVFALVDRWLSDPARRGDHLAGPMVELADAPLPKPNGDVEEVRAKIGQLAAKRREVELAPLSLPELEAKVRASVTEMARNGKPRFKGIDGRQPFEVSLPYANSLSFMAWMDPDGLTRKIVASLPKPDGAMSASAKAKTIADIEAQKLELERMEEAIIRASDKPIARRPDADVRAILAIEERPRAAVAA